MNFYNNQDLAERMAILKTAEALSWGLALEYHAVKMANGWYAVKVITDILPTSWQTA
jgi:hypothetical protein